MSDLRSMFESKDFVINSNIIKSISNLDITLDEFLLILYFINVSIYLDTEDVKKKLGFEEDKVVSTFTSLLNKKYITLDVKYKNGEVQESVNLDPLYDRLALNKKVDDPSTDIYALFEHELGRTISSFEVELINKWIENGVSEDTIKEALKEAILNNARSFKYIDSIIYNWSKKGSKIHPKDEIEKQPDEMMDWDWFDGNE
ncbi:MAG: DnaD domain protein [Bacilli bacterium]|nr:DnaD domain protein [Bacilli bacterium]